MSSEDKLGSPHGGGPQGEPVEGSLTDGGSLPGSTDEDRSFGAGRRAKDHHQEVEADGGAASVAGVIATHQLMDSKIFEGEGEDPGVIDDASGEAAEAGTEHKGAGATPPR